MGTDGPRYIGQAKTIVDQGKLPSRDYSRDAPVGRDMSRQLTLFPYALAHVYQLVSAVGVDVSLTEFAIVFPVACYALCATLIAVLTWQLYGSATAVLAVNLVGLSPLIVGRTTAGYADRDSFTLLLALAAFLCYVLRCGERRTFYQQVCLTLLCAGATILLALAWEGAAVYVSVIAGCEAARLLLSRVYTNRDAGLALAWAVPVALAPPMMKAVYRFPAMPHVTLMVGVPSAVTLGALLALLIRRVRRLDAALASTRRPPVGLLALTISLALCITVTLTLRANALVELARNLPAAFGSSPLAASIDELQRPGALLWARWPGLFWIAVVAGALLCVRRVANQTGLDPWLALLCAEVVLFGIVFSRMLSGFSETNFTENALTLGLYWGSLGLGVVGVSAAYVLAIARGKLTFHVAPFRFERALLIVLWALATLLCFRGAVRFGFLFAIPATILGAHALVEAIRRLSGQDPVGRILLTVAMMLIWQIYALWVAGAGFPSRASTLAAGGAVLAVGLVGIAHQVRAIGDAPLYRRAALTTLILYLLGLNSMAPTAAAGGYAMTAARTAEGGGKLLEETPLLPALTWLRQNTATDAVIAASWEYGSWIDLLGERATIVDEQQQPFWTYLMDRLVLTGSDPLQALSFLKTRQADYLLMTRRDIDLLPVIAMRSGSTASGVMHLATFAEQIAVEEVPNGPTYMYRYLISRPFNSGGESLTFGGATYTPGDWRVARVFLSGNEAGDTLHALVELDIQGEVYRAPPQEVVLGAQTFQAPPRDGVPLTLAIYAPSEDPMSWQVFCVSANARKTLLSRLFLFGELADTFERVYPPPGPDADFGVQIWRVHYPAEVRTDPLYLERRSVYDGWPTALPRASKAQAEPETDRGAAAGEGPDE